MDEIKDDLICTIKEKCDLESSGAQAAIIDTLTQKITDLEGERERALHFDVHSCFRILIL